MDAQDESRVQKLIRRLKHEDHLVRIHAGALLGDMGLAAKEAVPALLELLTGDSVQDRKLAAMTLGYIGQGASEAVPALRNALHDPEDAVRRLAASALAKIDDAGRARAA
jgi:HEAT repeat protein